MSSIQDRLKALGIATDQKPPQVEAPARKIGFPIENVVPGKEVQTVFGNTYAISKDFDPSYQHGWMALREMPTLNLIAEWSKVPLLIESTPGDIIFLDTETTGLSGGTGTYAFLIGLGYHTAEGFRVDQLFMRDPSEEAALLAALDRWLTPFKTIVTFNGKSFDLPLLNTRYTLNGITSPISTKGHVDLLHLARRLWRDRLPSRALGDLEKEIIGFYRQSDEVPGYLIPQYYFDYLRTSDSRPLSGVFYHNMIDIVTLAALFNFTANLLAQPEAADIPSLDLAAIARLYEELGHLEQAADLYEKCIVQGLPEEQFFRTIERFAGMRRKQNRPDLAAALWQHAAERDFIPAYVELSKYHEHVLVNIAEAIRWADRAGELARTRSMPGYQRKMILDELAHRLLRLEKKAQKAKPNE